MASKPALHTRYSPKDIRVCTKRLFDGEHPRTVYDWVKKTGWQYEGRPAFCRNVPDYYTFCVVTSEDRYYLKRAHSQSQ